jgi:cyclohexanone monooxygenase
MSDQPDVLVVGAGFAGMYASTASAWIMVKFSAVQSRWYWNRYGGALRRAEPRILVRFAGTRTGMELAGVFSAQEDILRYANHVADRFDLRRDMVFDRVSCVAYHDDVQRCA